MNYSVIIPVFNSEDSLEELFQRIKTTFENFGSSTTFEVIFVDDFSKDKSWDILKKLKNEFPDLLKIIRFAKNYGQHNAVFCGFENSSGERIVTIDDDLQQDPKDIELLITKMDSTNADLVYGLGTKKYSAARKIGSSAYKNFSKYVDGKYGQGSSFRLLTASLLKQVIEHKKHFVFLEEILFWYTDYIEVVEVKQYPRKYGKSGYSIAKIFGYMNNTSINYSVWPLKIMINGGALLSLISFLLGLYFIFKKIFLGIIIPGFTALIVSIFFSTSLLLMCFGIVGKYLNNIYIVLNEKPTYSIKEKL